MVLPVAALVLLIVLCVVLGAPRSGRVRNSRLGPPDNDAALVARMSWSPQSPLDQVDGEHYLMNRPMSGPGTWTQWQRDDAEHAAPVDDDDGDASDNNS